MVNKMDEQVRTILYYVVEGNQQPANYRRTTPTSSTFWRKSVCLSLGENYSVFDPVNTSELDVVIKSHFRQGGY